jgi:hypothetical protein
MWDMAAATRQAVEALEKALREMQQRHAEEEAPHVLVAAERPYGDALVYLVVKNVGKSPAKDVKLEYAPLLRSTLFEQSDAPEFIARGIGVLPPGYEIRTALDNFAARMDAKLPMHYAVEVSYSGDIAQGRRVSKQEIDLAAYRGIVSIEDGTMDDLLLAVQHIADHERSSSQTLERIVATLRAGIITRTKK